MAVRKSHRKCVFLLFQISTFALSSDAFRVSILERDNDCGTNSTWNPSVSAWHEANTDEHLTKWWTTVQSENPGATFASELAGQFGAQMNDFSCGIDDEGSCVNPGCEVYSSSGDEPWTYLALSAVVNLDTFLNRLWQGIVSGQTDYGNLAGALAETFFPWKEPEFGANDALIWVEATVGALVSLIDPELGLVYAGAQIFSNFVSAGIQEVQLNLAPDQDLTLLQGISVLEEAASASAEQARQAIETWASKLFSGQPDALNNTLLDYLKNGSFIIPTVYSNADFERFWKLSLISRTVNSQWRTRSNFVTFARTRNKGITIGPNISKYYSDSTGGVYYLYQWNDGRLDCPDGMLALPNPPWNIQPWEVTESSALSYEIAGFNYTASIALKQLKDSLFNSGSNPAIDGAHFQGLWTMPVCDMGDFVEWNGQYQESSMAPCCCGPNCSDTKIFVELANLKGDQSYLRQCRNQLQSTDISFSQVDYGFRLRGLCTGAIVGISFGAFFGVVLITHLLIRCSIAMG